MKEVVKFYRPYKGWIELNFSETGKTWTTEEPFIMFNEDGKQLTVPKGFVHDEYTFAPNLPDPGPAIGHDWARQVKVWDDGTPITFLAWNAFLRYLMLHSWDRLTRWMAWPYWVGASSFDWVIWGRSSRAKPLHEDGT